MVVATERVRRPADFAVPHGPRRDASCLFCGGHEDETPPELLAYRDAADAPPNSPGWRVRVVPNRFPALRVEGDLDRRGEGLYDLMNGVGADEVLVESADHHVKLADLTPAAVEDVVRALHDRLVALKRDARLRAALLFKRHAADAPGRLGHPHAQLLATPIVPPEVLEELDRARAYYDYRERCLFCDILRQELEQRTRLVVDSEHVLALAPFAARFPFETWLFPRRHAAGFERADEAEQRDLAGVLRAVLRRLDRAIGDPPFTLVMHSAPFREGESPSYHWHVEIMPTLSHAETAWRGGLAVNPVPPEDAARFLRDTPE